MNICRTTGKQSLSRSEALRKINELTDNGDDAADRLNAYRCQFCGRHHVGHRREPGCSEPMRRLNQ